MGTWGGGGIMENAAVWLLEGSAAKPAVKANRPSRFVTPLAGFFVMSLTSLVEINDSNMRHGSTAIILDKFMFKFAQRRIEHELGLRTRISGPRNDHLATTCTRAE